MGLNCCKCGPHFERLATRFWYLCGDNFGNGHGSNSENVAINSESWRHSNNRYGMFSIYKLNLLFPIKVVGIFENGSKPK